jgi:hypothetical protein
MPPFAGDDAILCQLESIRPIPGPALWREHRRRIGVHPVPTYLRAKGLLDAEAGELQSEVVFVPRLFEVEPLGG